MTALHLAAGFGHPRIVRLLLDENEIDINAHDEDGRTALSMALRGRRTDAVKQLLARDDLDLEAAALAIDDALNQVAEYEDNDLLDFLLARECTSRPGRTPLSWAAENGYIEVLRLLLMREDADANLKDADCRTPLSRAAEKGHAEVVDVLLRHGADANLADGDGMTPLWRAVENVHKQVVRRLAPVDTVTLLLLTQEGNQAAISLLLQFKPRFNQTNSHGQTALHLAALLGHYGIARDLMLQGVEANSKDNYGMMPLQLAINKGHVHIIRELLKHKAYAKEILAKEWRRAYCKQRNAIILLSEATDGGQYLDFPATFLAEELTMASSTIKSRLYLLTDDLNSSIWSDVPISTFVQEREPNKLQITSRTVDSNICDIFISLRLSFDRYLCDQSPCADDNKISRVMWRIIQPKTLGSRWTPIVYLSTLPYGWIPDDDLHLFRQFSYHLKEQWLKLCHQFEDHLSRRRLQQLESKGTNPETIDLLAKDAQRLANLRNILADQICEAEEFIKDYCLRFHANQNPHDLLGLLKGDIELGISKRIKNLDRTVRDLLNIEFAWITIHETRISTKLGQNVMLLTYVSIFYLPLGFCAALWAIPNITDNSTRTPFILTATVVSLVTLLITFNMEKIATIMQRGYQYCRDYIAEEWGSIASKFKQKKGKQYPSLP
ncbi:ankyrin repeat-containing domain protein [Trichoderma pleuroticola]